MRNNHLQFLFHCPFLWSLIFVIDLKEKHIFIINFDLLDYKIFCIWNIYLKKCHIHPKTFPLMRNWFKVWVNVKFINFIRKRKIAWSQVLSITFRWVPDLCERNQWWEKVFYQSWNLFTLSLNFLSLCETFISWE